MTWKAQIEEAEGQIGLMKTCIEKETDPKILDGFNEILLKNLHKRSYAQGRIDAEAKKKTGLSPEYLAAVDAAILRDREAGISDEDEDEDEDERFIFDTLEAGKEKATLHPALKAWKSDFPEIEEALHDQRGDGYNADRHFPVNVSDICRDLNAWLWGASRDGKDFDPAVLEEVREQVVLAILKFKREKSRLTAGRYTGTKPGKE